MTSVITELVCIFVYRQAEARLQVREFLAAIKTHLFPSTVVFSLVWCLFDTFLISILNFTLKIVQLLLIKLF